MASAELLDFQFSADLGGTAARFHALAGSIEDIRSPLLRTGGAIRARARRTFEAEGPGWAPLAESTAKRKLTEAQVALLANTGRGKTGQRSPVQRIVRDAKAARMWSAKAEQLDKNIEAKRAEGKKTTALEARRDKALLQYGKRFDSIRKHRFAAIAAGIAPKDLVAFAEHEVARQKRHGAIQRSYKALKRAGFSFAVEERRRMLRHGARRYAARQESTEILGGLADTIGLALTASDTGVKVYSKAYISGIHNEGGVAGHGARIPARPFLVLQPRDVQLMVQILREHMIDAWLEAEE